MKRTTAIKAAISAVILGTALAGCGSTSHRADDCINVPGAVIGGVAGGVVGHQFGSGRGRDIATGAGAATGAVVGSNVGC
ncbi:MAG TPA: glycine zipper 2TM domain-containing protein [Burkholderiales bacterium]|nr:glycine zipper 2TM domain-containing protein [Burkholderiales bacterium]